MRLLALNANTSAHITDTVAAEARETLGPGSTVISATGRFGPAVIKTRLDHAVATHAAVDLAARHAAEADAVLIAVSYDTALDAMREALGVPVVGMTEASVAMARMVGGRIGYVSLTPRTTPIYREAMARYGIERDMAGWRTLEAPQAYGAGGRSELDAMLAAAAGDLARDGADVAVLLGAVLAGAARRIGPSSPIPVLDGGRCGALMARAMVELAAPKPRVGSFAAVAGGSMTGVGDALAALAVGRTEPS